MAITVPAYIQQQFLSMIRVLHEHVGQEATRAYLKSLCTDASLDNLLSKTCGSESFLEKQRPGTPSCGEENIRETLTCLNDDDFTDETGAIDKRSRNMIDGRLFLPSTSQRFEENPFITTSNNEGDATSESRYPNIFSFFPSFPRPRLLDFLSKYWEILKMNGLYYHESA